MLNAAGLSLATIGALLPCARQDSPGFRPCDAFRKGLQRKLIELDRRIAALAEFRRQLRRHLSEAYAPSPTP